MATTISEEVYTVEEVAAIFRVPADTIRRLIQRGQLPALRLGRVYRVPKRVVAQLLEQPAASYAPEELRGLTTNLLYTNVRKSRLS